MRRSTEFDETVKYGMRTVQPDIVVHVRRGKNSGTGSGPRVGLIIAKPVVLPSNAIASPAGCAVARTMLGDLMGPIRW
jgi:ribonuclease P protein component